MKTINTAALGAVCLGLAFTFVENISAEEASQAIAPTSRMELFNGKDFTGWTFFLRTNTDPLLTFSVTNGVFHCTGQPWGYMRTAQNYRDYKLTIEWRFINPRQSADNSGIFLHIQPPDQLWPKAIEAQGQHQRHGNLILLGGATCKGHETPQTRGVRAMAPSNEKPAGEWNSYEIIAAGDTLKVSVNGKLMNEVTGCSITSGAIGIQSEGGEYEVRKVTLEPAPKP